MGLKKIVAALLLPLLVVCLSSCGGGGDSSSPSSPEATGLSQMVVTLATRPGATAASDVEALYPAAEASATAFAASLADDVVLQRFVAALPPILQAFRTAYLAAGQSADEIEAKAVATDQLFRSLIEAAEQAGITAEQFEMALLGAFADLQPRLSLPPLSLHFSDADRELVNLLLLSAVNQVHQRIVFSKGAAAMAALGGDAVLVETFLQLVSTMDAGLLGELRYLEEALADPLVPADETLLIQRQYSVEAMNDLALLKYGFELAGGVFPGSVDIPARIVERMNAVGGVMAGMTTDDLVQSGVAEERWFDSPEGLVLMPSFPSAESAVYDWVRPETALTYQPVPGLADDLLQLGGTVPPPPDFTRFADPYLAVFQLRYDFELCNQIATQEWAQAGNAGSNLLPTMQERLAFRQTQASRRQTVLARFSGAPDAEVQAITALWYSFR